VSSLAPARRAQHSHGDSKVTSFFSGFILVHRPTLKIYKQEIMALKIIK
jgi:hypothetical protein